MIYQEWRPEPAASHIVETFWHFSADGPDCPDQFEHQVVPDGLVSVHGGFEAGRVAIALVSGPSTTAKTLKLQKGVQAGGFRLRPGVARALLSIEPAALRDITIPLQVAAGENVDALGKVLVRLAVPEARAQANFGLARLPQAYDATVWNAGDRVLESWGCTSIAQLAAEAGLSPRQFRDRFGREAGLSPKAFAQVRRQRAAWIALVTGQAHSLSDASHAAGYADQAHFNRSARQAFGRTPGEVRSYVSTIRHRFDWLNPR